MKKPSLIHEDNFSVLGSSLSMRVIIIGTLALLMMIPLSFVNDTVRERGNRYSSTLIEIANTWGRPQTLMADR